MRLKVSWKENKLVVPSGEPTDKVSRLLKDIAARFSPYYTGSDDFIISELRTNDGYLVSPHLAIKDVICENDYLVALDFNTWKTEQYKLCTTNFEGTSVTNYEEKTTLTVNVGVNTKNNLYVAVVKSKELLRLDLFEYSDLSAFHKDGKYLITHWESGVNYAKASLNVVNGVVQNVEVEIKVESAVNPEIKVVGIKTTGKKIEKAEISSLQMAYDVTTLANVTFPELVKTGPSYPDYDIKDTVDGGNGGGPEDFANVTSTSGIRYEQVAIVLTEHSYFSNGNTNNYYYSDLQLTNTTPSRVTLTKLTAEYQDKQGNWVPTNAFFGVKGSGNYNYNWRWETSPIPLDSRDTIKLSINTRIQLPYRFAEKLKRSSKHLPNPFHFRVHITDDTQTTVTIPFIYRNKTEFPVCPTLKSRQESIGQSDPIVYFQTVDNVDSEARGFVQIVKKLDNYKEINVIFSCSFNGGTYYYISQSELNRYAYEAKKSNTTKHLVENFCAKNEDFQLQVFAMVNLEHLKTTGFCFELKSTSGSTSTGYFVMPSLI